MRKECEEKRAKMREDARKNASNEQDARRKRKKDGHGLPVLVDLQLRGCARLDGADQEVLEGGDVRRDLGAVVDGGAAGACTHRRQQRATHG